jgi:hypothetical protein
MGDSKDRVEMRSRPYLVWCILGLVGATIITILLVQKHRETQNSPAEQPSSEARLPDVATNSDADAVGTTAFAQDTNRVVTRPIPFSSTNLANLTESEIQSRAAELMQLAMNDDAASLEAILKELRNPNRGMRDAALQATIQFGSRDAIPRLSEAAQQTDDPAEKSQLLSAIEFLKLPSLTEVLKGKAPEASPPSVSLPSTSE